MVISYFLLRETLQVELKLGEAEGGGYKLFLTERNSTSRANDN